MMVVIAVVVMAVVVMVMIATMVMMIDSGDRVIVVDCGVDNDAGGELGVEVCVVMVRGLYCE